MCPIYVGAPAFGKHENTRNDVLLFYAHVHAVGGVYGSRNKHVKKKNLSTYQEKKKHIWNDGRVTAARSIHGSKWLIQTIRTN